MLLRWLSAIGGLILLFGTLAVFGATGLLVVGSVILLIAAIEFGMLFEGKTLWLALFLVADIIVYFTQVFAHFLPHPELGELRWTVSALASAFLILSALGIVLFRHREPKEILGKIQWTLWGVVYTALLPALTMRILIEWRWIPLFYLLVTVFFGDVGAFFCGRYIGGPKIFPNVSPKKTVSGSIGGLIASGVFGTLFLRFFSEEAWNAPLATLAMSLAIGLFAQFGDFFESLIKRVSGCKDSSQLMPGHGGILDRLDGVYFGSAVFYVFCFTLGYISYF